MDRRTFLRRSAVIGGGFAVMSPFEALGVRLASGAPAPRITGYGPLVPKGELELPAAFNYTVISRQGMPMRDGRPTPSCFDGMGAFPGPHGTTVLIRNHENRIARNTGGVLEIPVLTPGFEYDSDPTMRAGCTKLVVRREAEGVYTLVDHFSILGGTDNNCAGGVLPWKKWLTCEEVVRRSTVTGKKHGYVFEVDATAEGPVLAVPIPQMGRFAHEAAVWRAGIFYLTEDRNMAQGGSCLYRYIPDQRVGQSGNLAETTGVLQALKIKGEPRANMDVGRLPGVPYPVEWVTVPEPDHEDDSDMRPDRVPGFTPVRFQAQDRGAAYFDRQEGMWTGNGDSKIYFDCTEGGPKNLGQIWEYDPGRETLTLLYESDNPARLEGPDNIVVVQQTGDLFLCEDANAPQFVRGLTQQGELYDFAKSVTNNTEFAGACFDPDGQTLYLNQYGERSVELANSTGAEVPPLAGGVTYAIWGPFEKREGNRDHRLEPR
jgi:secreted PhoX family phosphatase